MHLLLNVFLRLFVLVAGLIAAAAIALAVTLLLALWGVRALWAWLMGRPVAPFVMRMGPRHAFGEMMRRAPARTAESRTPRTDAAVGPRGRLADVTDVDPK